jgi:hypothetical protein
LIYEGERLLPAPPACGGALLPFQTV